MRLESLSLKGLLRFTDPITLDLRDVPPGLVGITGENGAGKSTLLEVPFAALYREFASRTGALVDYATGRDSFLDCAFSVEGRGTFRARVNLDGVTRASDAVLEAVQANGAHVALNDGKVSTFSAVIDREFPSKALLLASSLSAQNRRGNFIGMKPAAAKQLFGELLGLAHYDTMSQTAKTIAAAVERAIDRLTAARDLLARDTDDQVVAELDRIAQELQVSGVRAETRQRELRATIAKLEARLITIRDQVAAYVAASERVLTLERELAGRQTERDGTARQRDSVAHSYIAEQQRIAQKRDADVAEIEKKLAGNQTVRDRADQIRTAVAAIATIDAQLLEARTTLDRQGTEEDVARRAVLAAEAPLEEVLDLKDDLIRARRDAGLLDTVPCGGSGTFATCQFLVDARAALARIPALEARVQTEPALRDRVADLNVIHQQRGRDVIDTRALIKTLETDRFSHQAMAKYAEPLAAAEARIAELTTSRQQTIERAAQLLAEAQARTDARLRELTEQGTTLDRTIARLTSERDTAQTDRAANEHAHAQAIVLQEDLRGARSAWDVTNAELARVTAARTDLTRRRQELLNKRAQLADVAARLGRLETERLDWQLLAKALGRDGLQVLEIDSAGPDVSATLNHLLAACFGPRFTAELVTQQAKADGKGMREDFSLQVFDNERGGDPRDVADLSGGEQTIVSEALMCAIAVYVNQRSPMTVRTLWRDETVGALDPENAVRYFHMLRKVHELGGYHHVFFISHNREVANLADAQIRVHDGKAAIVFPPYADAEAA